VQTGVLRTSVVQGLDGHFAVALAGLVAGLDPLETITLDLPGAGPRLFRAMVSNHLGDEAALKRGLDVKGSAGTVPCIKCRNVLYTRALVAPGSSVVTLWCPSPSKFEPSRDEDIWALADRLVGDKARVSKEAFAREEKVAGINYNPHSVLFVGLRRARFRPIGTLTFDSMHIWFSNGCANEELFLMMEKLCSIGLSWPLVGQWIDSKFDFPMHHKNGDFEELLQGEKDASFQREPRIQGGGERGVVAGAIAGLLPSVRRRAHASLGHRQERD